MSFSLSVCLSSAQVEVIMMRERVRRIIDCSSTSRIPVTITVRMQAMPALTVVNRATRLIFREPTKSLGILLVRMTLTNRAIELFARCAMPKCNRLLVTHFVALIGQQLVTMLLQSLSTVLKSNLLLSAAHT